jgi:hypothetical protein
MLQMVLFLLEHGSPANAAGDLPLPTAAMSGHLGVCQLLLVGCAKKEGGQRRVYGLGRVPELGGMRLEVVRIKWGLSLTLLWLVVHVTTSQVSRSPCDCS